MRQDRGRALSSAGRLDWLRLVTRRGRAERKELKRLHAEWRVKHEEYRRLYGAQQPE